MSSTTTCNQQGTTCNQLDNTGDNLATTNMNVGCKSVTVQIPTLSSGGIGSNGTNFFQNCNKPGQQMLTNTNYEILKNWKSWFLPHFTVKGLVKMKLDVCL